MKLITCSKCGKEMNGNETVCPHCGCPVNSDQNTNTYQKRQPNTPNINTKKKFGNLYLGLGCLGIFIIIIFVPIIIGLLVNSMIEDTITDNPPAVNSSAIVSTTLVKDEVTDIDRKIHSMYSVIIDDNGCITT